MKHLSKLPWAIIQQGYGPIIVDANGEIVARVDWGRGKQDETNAKYIVKLANTKTTESKCRS